MIPDYYARLGVAPGAAPDEIEAALRKKQPAWSMGTRNPKTRHANQLFLDEIPALRAALLSGPIHRAAYDAELAAAEAARREERLDELQRLVRLRAAKGGLDAADRELLRAEADRMQVDRDDLDRLLRPIPFLVEDEPEPGDDDGQDRPGEALEPSMRRQIRMALDHLGRRDLYDALDVLRDAPLPEIAARADEERQRWMKKAQVTAEKTAWLEIVSHAQTHLGDTKARARYDRTLEREAEEAFERTAAFVVKGLRRLDAGTHVALVDEAGAKGVPPDRAHRLIRRACTREGVAVEGPARPTSAPAGGPTSAAYKLLRCRNCSGLTELGPTARGVGAARCKHCGASLRWECPVCRRSNLVDAARCDCGFRRSWREPLARHFSAALHAFRSHDLDGARRHLEAVQRYAPQHVGARNGLSRIAEREREIDEARMAFEQAEAGGRLAAAARALAAWRRIVPARSPEVAAARDRIAERLKKAETLASRGRRLERTDPPEARRLYLRSLNLAADLPAAVQGLIRCPPDPPTNLDARVVDGRVRLSWTPPEPDGLEPPRFVVVRRLGGLPEHPSDGVRIGETSSPVFEDGDVEPGATVSYAVLSRRGAAESLAAVAAGPIAFLPDVRGLHGQAGEGEILLAWDPPAGAVEVRVVKGRDALPRSPRDGLRLPAARDGARDPDVEIGRVYHYAVFAIYRDAAGRRFPSPGATLSIAAGASSAPVGPPKLTVEATGRVTIEWTEPTRGTLRLRRTVGMLPLAPGASVTDSEVERTPGAWIVPVAPGRAEDWPPGEAAGFVYTPMVARDGGIVVGRGASPSPLRDPSDLRAVRLDPPASERDVARIQLRWNWPLGVDSARIVARRGAAPVGPADPEALLVDVRREEYDRQGAWILIARPPTPSGDGVRPLTTHWHIRVYSMDRTGADAAFSAGLEPTAETVAPGPHPEVTISYRWKRPWVPGRPWTLIVKTEPHGAETPPLLVVGNPRAVPVSAEDGEVLARLPAGRDGSSHPVSIGHHRSADHLRVFLDPAVEPDSTPPIRVRHPEAARARV